MDRRTTSDSLGDILDSESRFTAIQKECATASLHMIQFYQGFPHVSTASDERWGEKAWVRGYMTIS